MSIGVQKSLALVINIHQDLSGKYTLMGDNMNQLTQQHRINRTQEVNYLQQVQLQNRRRDVKIQNYTQLTKSNEVNQDKMYQFNSNTNSNRNGVFAVDKYPQDNQQQVNQQPPQSNQHTSYSTNSHRPEILPYSNMNLKIIQDNIMNDKGNDHPVSILPSSAFWFNLDEVNNIEKQAFPECFTSNVQEMDSNQNSLSLKSQEMFVKIRNFIVQTYRSNPKQYLTATKCRRSLVGDVQFIIKIHAFLEHWGIINFNINFQKIKYDNVWEDQIHRLPQKIVKIENNYANNNQKDNNQNGNEKLKDTSLKLLTQNLRPICDFCGYQCNIIWYKKDNKEMDIIQIDNQQKLNESTEQKDQEQIQQQSQPEKQEQNNEQQQKQQQQQQTQQPQSQEQQQEQQQEQEQQWELILCMQCYSEKKYPNILSESDFQKCDLLEDMKDIETKDKVQKGQFMKMQLTAKEELKLLEVLSKHKDNWPEIEKQLGKSQQQIIVEFMQIAINSENIKKIIEKLQHSSDDIYSYPLQKGYQNNLNVFQDQSNPIFLHAITREESIKGKTSTKHNPLLELSDSDKTQLMELEKKSIEKAKHLREREVKKMRDIVSLLVEQQMNKLNTKASLMETYHKIIVFEKQQLQLHQNTLINCLLQKKIHNLN